LSVFVLDKRKRPVMPCCERRARLLLERGRAVVRDPFMIRLKDRLDVEPVRVKLDPGSRTTGIAVVADAKYCKLLHRGYCYARQSPLPPRPEEHGFQLGRL
jgi:hypothetical protein